MTHQVAVTILAPVLPGRVEDLRAVLQCISGDPAGNSAVPFGRVEGVHFARLVLLDATAALDGAPLAPKLLLLLDCDAPARRRLAGLVRAAGAGFDDILQHCEGYPAPGARSERRRFDFLRRHTIKTDVSYVNTIGRPLSQIRAEAGLREAIEDFLDEPQHEWSRATAVQVRAAIQAFIARREDLRWALQPAQGPGLAWRVREKLHLALNVLLILATLPIALLAAPVFALLLRWHEKRDPAPRLIPDPEHVARLAADEDHLAQNQFTAVGHLKPGGFRRLTATIVLWLVNLGTRHIYNNGVLTGVKTIHAARWVFVEDRRRLIFASNYDGSLENYMDDFIDKVSWGLNAVFSNGLEYPRTNWLVRDGAEDELAFKGYIRVRQVPSDVWYTACGNLTTVNIAQNARIRAGLAGDMDESAAAAWLRLL